jgi:hypothetical protein
MKLLFNIKFNVALLLCLVILAILWHTGQKMRYKEGYEQTTTVQDGKTYVVPKDINAGSLFISGVQNAGLAVADAAVKTYDGTRKVVLNGKEYILDAGNRFASDIDKTGDSVSSFLDTISDFIDTSEYINLPQSRHVYGDGSATLNTITMGLKPDTSVLITDGCSKRSILRSEFEEDICTKYAGDSKSIDAKCKMLDNNNCNLPDCCILLNGTKCIAGDVKGPSYLTDQGNKIDYNYYLYKNKCYGAGCDNAGNNYEKHCGMYAKNSTGISKACMVEMFKDAGCSDSSFIIDDVYVYNNSKSSKQYINNNLIVTANTLLEGIKKADSDSKVKCNPDGNNPCDKYLSTSTGISKACMIKMYNDAGCKNSAPLLISDQFVSDNNDRTKDTINDIISKEVTTIKSSSPSTSVCEV